MSMTRSTPGISAESSATGSPLSTLPKFHLLCMLEKFSEAFTTAVDEKYPALREKSEITIHNCSLQRLRDDLRFEAVVSPANSYARLDGAFDDALAHVYGPADDYDWITRKAQKTLYENWRGFAPPGTCTVVPLGDDDEEMLEQPWGTKYLLLCPTMRIPWNVNWDREVVYECIWSLLCAVDQHNRQARERRRPEDEIKSILMTPLGTGVGQISPQRWAEQCVIAMKHWVEAVEKPEKWGRLEWKQIFDDHEEVVETYQREM